MQGSISRVGPAGGQVRVGGSEPRATGAAMSGDLTSVKTGARNESGVREAPHVPPSELFNEDFASLMSEMGATKFDGRATSVYQGNYADTDYIHDPLVSGMRIQAMLSSSTRMYGGARSERYDALVAFGHAQTMRDQARAREYIARQRRDKKEAEQGERIRKRQEREALRMAPRAKKNEGCCTVS
ncbi:hypothetical protein MyNCGM683_06560 [Achromobacter xylosoxidans]